MRGGGYGLSHSPNWWGAWGSPRPPEALGLSMLSGALFLVSVFILPQLDSIKIL